MVTRLLKRWARYILHTEMLAARRQYIALDQKYCAECQARYIAQLNYNSLRVTLAQVMEGKK